MAPQSICGIVWLPSDDIAEKNTSKPIISLKFIIFYRFLVFFLLSINTEISTIGEFSKANYMTVRRHCVTVSGLW